ncbi:MAG: aspartate--tRNA(Asn) ligase [Thermoproteales archaeon]|nr:aspartate--tRNA(Asn) ligase [Thermoproteales archaeon]
MALKTTIYGWVANVKVLKKIAFVEAITNNDLTYTVIVVKKEQNPELWKKAREIELGSAIKASGTYPEKSISKRGREFHADDIVVLNSPIDVMPLDPTGKTPAQIDTNLNYRYLALRFPEQRAIFSLRAKVVNACREFFIKNGFLEVHTPKICGAGAEGGATVFTLDYFGRTAFLAQSPQLYKQMLMAGVSRVYEIGPYFRAEKFSTTRHLNESWGVDAEIAFMEDAEDVMSVLEKLILYVFDYLQKNASKELETLGVSLKKPRSPFKRLSYNEAIEVASSQGSRVKYGEDLDTESEFAIGKAMEEEGYDAYFIYEYPWEIKPFYIMRRGNELSFAFDLDYRGLELASGGQREHRYHELIKNIKDKGLNPESFAFYLEAFKYGMPPHGGFGLGLDRLVMKIVNKKNIREVVLFPRDRQRLVP